MKLGINASRARSGGARAHLIGILTEGNSVSHGFAEVHVWSYRELLDALPDLPWLVKHCPPETEQSILRQLWWERFGLPKALRALNCDVLLNVDAGTVCRYGPSVTMSQDMLSYELGEMIRFGLSRACLRLFFLRYIQSRSMRNAVGVIFLTSYAAKVIQQTTGLLKRFIVIPHGIGEKFRQSLKGNFSNDKEKIRLLYVSNASMYKHQWNVVRAIGQIRQKGFNVSLLLVGGGKGRAQKLLDHEMLTTDAKGEFIEQKPFVDYDKIPGFLACADVFIFASSCENLPITLLEAMASGLPIACSNRGPMPEVLKDGGVYFDPENSDSIAQAVERIIINMELRTSIARRAKELSEQYSWKRCSAETWKFLMQCVEKSRIAKRESVSKQW